MLRNFFTAILIGALSVPLTAGTLASDSTRALPTVSAYLTGNAATRQVSAPRNDAAVRDDRMLAEIEGRFFGSGSGGRARIYGKPFSEGGYVQKIRVEVADEDGNAAVFALPCDSGYAPRLFAADFCGAGYEQLFYAADSGGSGGYGYYYLLDAQNKRLPFDFERDAPAFRAEFADGFRVVIRGENNRFVLDCSDRRDAAFRALYDDRGLLRQESKAQVYPIGYVAPAYDPAAQRWNLWTCRDVCGLCHADRLATIAEKLVWDGSAFRAERTACALSASSAENGTALSMIAD